ncbi:uncharacterized protein LOC128954106 [Oppia nitens]|uniref:uncharacterized protein LOC128954106 n=1 Tax=Oppia nitens TaxID=1686743 RepID=UPI0023DA0625|nr:uncharacterized protein LOC128954106 [Oppia nitens]
MTGKPSSNNIYLKVVLLILCSVLAIVWAVTLTHLIGSHRNQDGWRPDDILTIVFLLISFVTVAVAIYASWYARPLLCRICMYIFAIQACLLLGLLVVHIIVSGSAQEAYVLSNVGFIIVLCLIVIVLYFYIKDISMDKIDI